MKETLLSPGEVADMATIQLLKLAGGPDNAQCGRFLAFLSALWEQETWKVFEDLLRANAEIWRLESAIRQGKEGDMSLSDIGTRALKIRDVNNRRIELKNKLSQMLGWNYKEVKIDHASQNPCLHDSKK